jgi:hypothetical protein
MAGGGYDISSHINLICVNQMTEDIKVSLVCCAWTENETENAHQSFFLSFMTMYLKLKILRTERAKKCKISQSQKSGIRLLLNAHISVTG